MRPGWRLGMSPIAYLIVLRPAASSPSNHLFQILCLGDEGKLSSVSLDGEQAHEGNFTLLTAGEDRVHAVVIALADRVELVIVTTGARYGQSEKRRAHGIDRIGLPFGAILLAVVGVLDGEGAERKQACADSPAHVVLFLFGQLVCSFQIQVARPQFVGGDLLL